MFEDISDEINRNFYISADILRPGVERTATEVQQAFNEHFEKFAKDADRLAAASVARYFRLTIPARGVKITSRRLMRVRLKKFER